MTNASMAEACAPAPAADAPAAGLRLFRPRDPLVALGLAVNHLMSKPAFAQQRFGAWARVLVGQINRGHCCFVLDPANNVVGFLGWAFASEDAAEAWLEGRKSFADEGSPGGDCMIINGWAADTAAVNRILHNAARRAARGKRFVFFKRFYGSGTVRRMRMPVNAVVGRNQGPSLADPGRDGPAQTPAVRPRQGSGIGCALTSLIPDPRRHAAP
jgi:hemolysin-activating ACP:hemolysin acyltransferase